ncbi:uncharacterized protein AAEQ78_002926 [Lycaon pictus]
MHVPSVAAAAERSAAPAERSDACRHPEEPQRIKVLREPGQRRGFAAPGDAARSARSRRRAGEAPPRPARSQLRAVPTKRKRGGGEGRARCLARGGDPSPLLRGLPGPNTAAPRQSERRFPRELASPLESRAPPGSVPPSGPQHCSAVPASPGIRQARRDALCRLAKRGGRDPTVGTSRGRRASLRPRSLLAEQRPRGSSGARGLQPPGSTGARSAGREVLIRQPGG